MFCQKPKRAFKIISTNTMIFIQPAYSSSRGLKYRMPPHKRIEKTLSKRLLLATALKASLNSCTLTEISSGSNERHHREAYLMPRHKLDLLLKMVVYYTLEVPAVTKYEISLRKYPICPKIFTLSELKIIWDLTFLTISFQLVKHARTGEVCVSYR